jgi:hypothetical protein
MLEQGEVASYLLERKLVSAESIVAGDLQIVDVSRRNRNYKVISERGPSYLLKQGISAEGMATLAHEAAVYRLFDAASRTDRLHRYLPRCYGYDAEAHILVLQLLPSACDLREHHVRCGRFSNAIAGALGDALGALRQLKIVYEKRAGSEDRTPQQPPWALSIHRTGLSMFQRMSSASIEFLRMAQQCPDFCERLDRLRQGWREEALIHYDMKWDNCVVSQSDRRRRSKIKIVDWELANIGDPCWDPASVISDYLCFWLLSIPVAGETPPDHLIKLARYPLERLQPAIHTFWRAYVRRLGLGPETAFSELLRTIQYAAVRLIQTAVEQMQVSERLTGHAVYLLQLSLNILCRPHEAVVDLLGEPLRQSRIA